MVRRIPDLAVANPVIMGLLEYVLDRRDEQILAGEEKPIALTLDPQKASRVLRAALAPFTDPTYDDGELWDELVWLSRDYRCFSIRSPGRQGAGSAAWQGARLYFEDGREQLIREWLHRPRPQQLDPAWREALSRCAHRFENPSALPPGGLELEPGFRDLHQLLECWASVGDELRCGQSLSWRQLSARSFLGDSKYLDGVGRQSLVCGLFPSLSRGIAERPLLMHLYLPAEPRQVLLIENQDSFLWLAERELWLAERELWLAEREPGISALVYIEGYRGGAARIRAPGIARFSALNQATLAARRDFLQWWQGQAERELPVYFWGDLDLEGMSIAAALKRSFSNLDCWRPGYEPLLAQLRAGGGHLPQQARKQGQREIEETGCDYADTVLIPALMESGRFVDQEAISF